jgi:hypothetical protein
MAIVSNTYESASVTNIPEQLLNRIDIFAREETPVYSTAKKGKAERTDPEWFTDVIRAAGANALVEGGALTATARTPAVKVKNHTQIFTDTMSITGTNQASKKHGISDERARQLELASRALKRDFEFAITQNAPSVVTVSDTTAGKLGGIETWATSNVSRGTGGSNGGYNSGTGVTAAATDGTQRLFTEDLLLNVMQTAYDNGANLTQLHTGSFNKQRVSGFSGNATRFSEEKSMISNTITVIENDFGKVKCMINPQQRTRTAILYDMSKIEVLKLRPLFKKKLAETNDSMEESLITEFTTRVVEKGIGIIADLTTA